MFKFKGLPDAERDEHNWKYDDSLEIEYLCLENNKPIYFTDTFLIFF